MVGESGSGKTVLAHSLLRLLPRNTDVSGSIRLDGRELLDLAARELRRVRARPAGADPAEPGLRAEPRAQARRAAAGEPPARAG